MWLIFFFSLVGYGKNVQMYLVPYIGANWRFVLLSDVLWRAFAFVH